MSSLAIGPFISFSLQCRLLDCPSTWHIVPPPGSLPRSILIEANLLRRLALDSKDDNRSLSNSSFVQQSTVSLISLGTALTGGGMTTCSSWLRARASACGESPVYTPRAGVGVCSFLGGGVQRSLFVLRLARTSPSNTRFCVIFDRTTMQGLCLGHIGESLRFCIAPKESGYTHCETMSHARFSAKIHPKLIAINLRGGIVSGRPCTLMEPCLPADCVSRNLVRDRFSEEIHTSQQWVHVIIDAAPHVSVDNEDDVGGEEEGDECWAK